MSQTAATQQALILALVGDPDGTVAPLMATLWDTYTEKASIFPRLQALYVQRGAIDIRITGRSADVDFSDEGQSVKLSQEVARLSDMRQDVQNEIGRLEARARANRVAQVGAIATVVPEAVPVPGAQSGSIEPDANDVRYQGDPYDPLPSTIW